MTSVEAIDITLVHILNDLPTKIDRNYYRWSEMEKCFDENSDILLAIILAQQIATMRKVQNNFFPIF